MNRENKLKKLRNNMIQAGISAVVIPTSDPHSCEYAHSHWKTRAYFSGFDGSAGTLVITTEDAGLWTDFRYYIQASKDLKNSKITLFKQGMLGVESITDYLNRVLKPGDVVGVDGSLFTAKEYEEYITSLKPNNITINKTFDPTDSIWSNRPPKAKSKVFCLNKKYCGESREDKITRVRNVLKEKGADTYLISALADIAWLLNIRGADVDYTPLVVSYVLLGLDKVELFIDSEKLPTDVRSALEESGIKIRTYSDIADCISRLSGGSTLYYMPQVTSCYLASIVPDSVNVIKGLDITTELKAIKNSTEIDNIRVAMEKDGVALVKFYKDFENRVGKEQITEYSLETPLRDARLAMDGCVDESFSPVIGYKSNGALCHYSAAEDTALNIEKNGLLLIDSGGQYYQGTTDITRTITLGDTTEDEKRHYTLVLKGHIQMGLAKFPEGTTGGQIDILARQPLWNNGLNFGHGTGHGIGFFLGVHEGPQNISPKNFETPIKDGMLITNEPGMYIEGQYGIRIENVVLATTLNIGTDQDFLGFETLTLYPYDLNLIIKSMLTPIEIDWVNSYHKEVLKRLSGYLTPEEITWLQEKTIEI